VRTAQDPSVPSARSPILVDATRRQVHRSPRSHHPHQPRPGRPLRTPYYGVCAIYQVHRDNDTAFKERLVCVCNKLPNLDNLTAEGIKCRGCMSDDRFAHCERCEISNCAVAKGIGGCHECADFPCGYINNFPNPIGRKVVLRTVPYRREFGTERWMTDEEARYACPDCGNLLFRGAGRCSQCKTPVDLD